MRTVERAGCDEQFHPETFLAQGEGAEANPPFGTLLPSISKPD
ncbi:hypothetical protein [Sphingomonas hominis]|nr:hypothetical protein [Sphingomonas hominis]